MIQKIGLACIAASLLLELGSYWKQISKTLRDKDSSNVSSSAYVFKIAKYLVTLLGLAIYSNWVGFGLELGALVFCGTALWIICKYKPEGWRLF